MAQHDYNIANQTAAQFRSDLNDALEAIATNNSGTSVPTTTYANQWFYDTDDQLLKIRKNLTTDYLNVGYIDQTDGFEVLDDTKVVDTSGTPTGLIGDQDQSTWTTGTETTESLVSPAKIKAAAEAFCLGSFNATNQLFNHPSGLQLRFGTFSSTLDSSEAFTFTTAFSTACLVVVTSVGGSVPVKSITGFSFNRLDSYSGTHVSDYIALGH